MKEMRKTKTLLSQWEDFTEVERSQFFYVLPFVEQRVALMCVRQDAVKETPERIEIFDKGMRFEGYSPNVENLARALYARGLELYENGTIEPTTHAKDVAQKNRPGEKDTKGPK